MAKYPTWKAKAWAGFVPNPKLKIEHTAIRHKGTQNHVWKLFRVKVVSEEIIIRTQKMKTKEPRISFPKVYQAASLACT